MEVGLFLSLNFPTVIVFTYTIGYTPS